MNRQLVDRVTQAVLYEGYILYPYRPALKNRQRWTFGGIFPRDYSEKHRGSDVWRVQTECLVVASSETTLDVTVRFLHLMERTVGEFLKPLSEWPANVEPEFRAVASLTVEGKCHSRWQEAVEREVVVEGLPLSDLRAEPQHREFTFPGCRKLEPIRRAAGDAVGLLVREQRPIIGEVEIAAARLSDDVHRLTVGISNQSKPEFASQMGRDEVLMDSLVSAHTLLEVHGGQFMSLTDPPEPWRELASECHNVGTWPVLVGDEGDTDTMLSAPIILSDYPQVAPESPGDFFDGTEIDEMLTLRILTLTDEEQREMAGVDAGACELLARTQAMAREELASLHGTFRPLRPRKEEKRHA